jgi:starch synthase
MIEEYPNPMLVKLTKEVWKRFPYFVFIGECWGTVKFHNRHIPLSRSGIIPRMYTLPRALSAVFGRRIHRNGYIEKCQPVSVSIFKEMLEENDEHLPEGAIVIQSSCGQVWPYPALLYGRGNWSAVDLLFTLPDVPMTFMEEINGEAYRLQITNVYEHREVPKNPQILQRSKSFISLDFDEKETDITSNSSNNGFSPINNVKSMTSLSKVSNIAELKNKQNLVSKEVGPEFGFDLSKIRLHYDHRRKMRSIHESLRRGSLLFLDCYDLDEKPNYHVFAYARHCNEETGVIAINFHHTPVSYKLDMKPLLKNYNKEINFNAICYIEDWITEEKGELYFIREAINEFNTRVLNVNIL